LHDALEFARSGDMLIVWKLDRLARSMKQLIETIENLRVRGIGFRRLTEALDTTTAQPLTITLPAVPADWQPAHPSGVPRRRRGS
jgi:DNA invertase Pin-like site-specific DNA recombinase